MTRRQPSVEELIQQETAKILQKILPKEIVATVTDASVSKDLRQATIWIAVYQNNQEERFLALLNRNQYKIQNQLNQKIQIKYVPKISFKIDRTGEKADKIDSLLDRINGN